MIDYNTYKLVLNIAIYEIIKKVLKVIWFF